MIFPYAEERIYGNTIERRVYTNFTEWTSSYRENPNKQTNQSTTKEPNNMLNESWEKASISRGDRVVFSKIPFDGLEAQGGANAAHEGDVGVVMSYYVHPSKKAFRLAGHGTTEVEVKFDKHPVPIVVAARYLIPELLMPSADVRLNEQLKSLTETYEKAKAEIETKISYLKESGASTFDPEEFRVWQALTAIEDINLSKMERTKKLAALIKGK